MVCCAESSQTQIAKEVVLREDPFVPCRMNLYNVQTVSNKRSRNFLNFFEIFFEVFVKSRRKESISLIVRAPWHVREVESYALSKFQPPTMFGDPQNVEKTIGKQLDFF